MLLKRHCDYIVNGTDKIFHQVETLREETSGEALSPSFTQTTSRERIKRAIAARIEFLRERSSRDA